ncbi:hypothetical protein INR49_032540, partial [Caranx melampygus]
MAFPVTSIFHTFSRSYLELKEEQNRALRQKPDSQDSTKSQNSEDSQETDSYHGITDAAASALQRRKTLAAQRAAEIRAALKRVSRGISQGFGTGGVGDGVRDRFLRVATVVVNLEQDGHVHDHLQQAAGPELHRSLGEQEVARFKGVAT